MKYIIFILIIGIFSCTTLKNAEGYFDKHPDKAAFVAKKYVMTHQLLGAKICIDAFPQRTKIDTFSVVKDSLIVENITDTIYKWFTKVEFVNRDKIKKILLPCNDSMTYISKTIYDSKYEVLYNDINAKYINVSDAHKKVKNILFWTWFWVFVLVAGAIFYIKK